MEESIDISSATRAERIAYELAAHDRARAAADRARAAADRVAVAAERRHVDAILRTPHLDELTGVFRSVMGELLIAGEIARAKRSKGRLVVAIANVDRLAGINDREGRAAGDQVLRSIGQLLQARTRPFDPIVRYGGDEFLCILGGATIEDARRRIASISREVLESSGVTLAIGLARLTDGDLATDLIYRARVSMLIEKTRRRSSTGEVRRYDLDE